MPDLDQLLNARGQTAELGAPITATAFSFNMAAFALGDGTIHLLDEVGWRTVYAHKGATLSLSAHPSLPGFCAGGDDGGLLAISASGSVAEIAKFGSKWVEHIAIHSGKSPLIAASAGKNVHLFTGDGKKLRELPHPSTVTGVSFDAKGKRVAASHYNGASLWFTASNSESPRKLEWKGSHLGVAIHPAGDALITGMQENALHGWTLPEGKHMRMAGYPAKPESFGFSRSGRWLATAGADVVVLWPFFGGGPMGKAPTELGAGDENSIVKQIACHPDHEVVAAGFSSGLVIIIDIVKEQILPACAPGRGAITALAWNQTGSHLAFGADSGFAGVIDLSSAE